MRRKLLVPLTVLAVLGVGATAYAVAGTAGPPTDAEPVAAGAEAADATAGEPAGEQPTDGEDAAARVPATVAAAAQADVERMAARERAAAEQRAEQARLAEEARQAAEAAEAERRAAEERAAEQARQFVATQERLRELGYLVGAADGQQGQQTTAAIMAFQAVNGLAVDGAIGPQTLAALDAPRAPSLRDGPATRIEVDMDRQVLHLVEAGTRVTTMKVSTGRGGTFSSADGQTLRADTPVGTFPIERRIAGKHESSYGIGAMWDPMYFYGPWAIHGSPDVRSGPASSGCVRISLADGRWLFDRVPDGTPVVLYGGVHVFTP